MAIKNRTNKYTTIITIIKIITIIMVLIMPFCYIIPDRIDDYYNPCINVNLNNQEAKAQNSIFESYFGTDVTAQEVKYLLSEVRTNNLTASRNEESATIGICYISRNATGDGTNGVYGGNTKGADTNPADIDKTTFDEMNFTPDVQLVTNLLEVGTSYTVNVPNTKAWKADQQGRTGFGSRTGFESKKEDGTTDELGATSIGKDGGYYSSGYIRLIYIIDNANRSPQGAENN